MAWNESGNGKNPWDRGGGSGGPPDLDKIVRAWQQRLNTLFGGRRQGSSSGNNTPMLTAIIALFVIGWAATGLYRVDDAERGVVLRFGQYQQTTLPGLRWHIPFPVESRELVNVTQIVPFNQKTSMLTADENIVEVDLVVQFRRADATSYLFNVRDPDGTLSDASESAIREVIGKRDMDFILGEGRAEIAQNTREVIQEVLDEYGAGIIVSTVNLQDVNFPGPVEAAVQDAIKAREDKERLSFEAESYANDIVPRARGEAVRRTQDAEAYKFRVIADADGEAARFEKLLVEYEKAPEVTRARLYIDAMEDVYTNANKVLLDASGSGNLLYLPVDKLIERGAGSSAPLTGGAGGAAPGGGGSTAGSGARQDPRQRGTR
jgi:membrane protease subunit HflK